MIAEYDRDWYDQEPYLQNRWRGWPIVKHPNDLFAYQEIISETRPDLIVETGTYQGGSALFFADMLKINYLEDSRVLTVDLAPAEPLPKNQFIEYLVGLSSTDLRVLEQVRQRAAGKKTMVVLDSDHRAAHVLKELQLYSPLVSKGCYLIVEDTHPLALYDNVEDGMAAAAVRKWNPGKHGFETDKDRERFLFSQNPNGFLKKVR